jgi:hypothetical protein
MLRLSTVSILVTGWGEDLERTSIIGELSVVSMNVRSVSSILSLASLDPSWLVIHDSKSILTQSGTR